MSSQKNREPLAGVNSIVVATDLSDASIPALRYAALIARQFAAKLAVVYVEPIAWPVEYAPTGSFVTATRAQRDRLREQLATHAREHAGAWPHEVDVMTGEEAATILEAARNHSADLILTGSRGRRGWRRTLLGSVSEAVIHGSSCPVLTVRGRDGRGEKEARISHVLCPVNFTDIARASVRSAMRYAEAFDARLTIVHVVESDTGERIPDVKIRAWLDPDIADACAYRELVVRGGPAERVLDCAEDLGADLLVIGAQHKLFRDTTIAGSTTERLLRFASCPVLVVPRPAAATQESGTRESAALAF